MERGTVNFNLIQLKLNFNFNFKQFITQNTQIIL
jgi:hypothetical protein